MRNKHLNTEEFHLLSNGKLNGEPLAKALLHVEDCEICQAKVATPKVTQIFNAVFAETASVKTENAVEKTARDVNYTFLPRLFLGKRVSFSLGIGAACAAILATVVGITWWSSSPAANSTVAQKTATAVSPSPETTAQNEVAKVSPQTNSTNAPTEPPTAASKTESVVVNNSKSTLKKNQLQRNALTSVELTGSAENKTKVNQVPHRLIANTAQSFTNVDQEELNQFLTKLPTVLASLRPPAIQLRSGETGRTKDNFKLLTPRGEVIRETQPYFKWQTVENAQRYKIFVYDRDYNQIAGETTESNSYQLKSLLERGKTYLWQVSAQIPNGEVVSPRPPASPALFRVASNETIALLERLKTEKFSWKFVSALLKQGLLGEAEAELNKQLKRAPQDQLAQTLLNRVQALRNDATIGN